MPSTRPTQIALGNDFDIWFEGVKVRGEPDDTLDLRGFIAATRSGGPIHASLTATAVAQGGGTGDYLAAFNGATVQPHLAPKLHTRVWIVGESVPPGIYREAFPVTVVEDQGA